MIQTIVRTSVPGVTTTVGQPQVIPAAVATTPAPQAVPSGGANPSKLTDLDYLPKMSVRVYDSIDR